MGVVLPRTTERKQPPAAPRGRKDSPQAPSEGVASGPVREELSLALNHQMCGNLLRSFQNPSIALVWWHFTS